MRLLVDEPVDFGGDPYNNSHRTLPSIRAPALTPMCIAKMKHRSDSIPSRLSTDLVTPLLEQRHTVAHRVSD
jgi:hypothetical protein